MSKRMAVLCDKTFLVVSSAPTGKGRFEPNTRNPCTKMAIGTCPVCDHDVCADHALHPEGGVVVTILLRKLNTATKPPMTEKLNEHTATAPLCIECSKTANTVFDDAAKNMVDTIVVALRAALATEATK